MVRVVVVAVVFLVAAAAYSSRDDEPSARDDSARALTSLPVAISGTAASPTADYPDELMQACRRAGTAYQAMPIAAFPDPSDRGNVVCWADGQVAKSPPPGPGGSAPPSFDRLVFTATTEGTFLTFVAAGYRDRFNVAPPCRQAPFTATGCT